MAKISLSAFEDLGRMIKPPPAPKKKTYKPWSPILTPAQEELFHCFARYPLAHGEKGSSKTWGAMNKLVRHCFENRDALALVVVRVTNMATKGGAWDKLNNEILPAWRDGNRDREGNLLDDGLGLQFTEVKFTTQRNEYIHIANQFGGWSLVVLISAPNASQLKERIRGFEPSLVVLEEVTSCDDPVYFESIAAQLGRRRGIDSVQQLVGTTNPDGQDHWAYKKWFIEPFDEVTGLWDDDFQTIHFPIDQNIHNLPDGYIEGLKKVYKHNEIEYARMVGGEWRDMPSGDGLFSGLYNPQIHVRPTINGVPNLMERLLPDPKHPFIIGLDPGSVYNAYVLMQWLRIEGKLRWMPFDEIVLTRKRVPYPVLLPIVMRRITWWYETIGAKPPMVWVSDNSAFNQYRAAAGSYDVLEIEKIYEERRGEYDLPELKIRQAPKTNGSKAERTRILQNIFAQDEIIISSGCPRIHQMALKQVSEKQKLGEAPDPTRALTPMRSDHVHVLDALTYPMLLACVSPTALVPSSGTQMLSKAA